jgi:hypothetical protein
MMTCPAPNAKEIGPLPWDESNTVPVSFNFP